MKRVDRIALHNPEVARSEDVHWPWHFWLLRFGGKQKAGTSTQHRASTHLAAREMHVSQHERLHFSIDAGKCEIDASSSISLSHLTTMLLPTCDGRHIHQISNRFPRKTAPRPSHLLWVDGCPPTLSGVNHLNIFRSTGGLPAASQLVFAL
jgi:hypothetical protein